MTKNADKAKVVAAGHISLDIYPTFHHSDQPLESILVPGKLIDVGPAVTSTGGSVSNTGLALNRLGVPARLMAKVGDDLFGKAILTLLSAYGAALADEIIIAPGESTSYTIVISPAGVDRMFLHCTGTNDTFSADDLDYDKLDGASILHFGYPPLMRQMYTNGGAGLESLLSRARQKGLTVSLDMARPDPASTAGKLDWQAMLNKALPHVDVFEPSIDEILYMLDRDCFDRLQASAQGELTSLVDGALLGEIAARLLDMGVAIVVLKLGDQGLYLRTTGDVERLANAGPAGPKDPGAWAGRELLAPCFEVDVVGTTGAGDCTIAGFLAGLLEEMTPEETVTSAVAVGACNVEAGDSCSGIPTWQAVQERIKSRWKRRQTTISLPGWQWSEAGGIWTGPNDASHRS